ncbi:AAA family ATPase, partial [Actinomadura chokoriensis]|uniref:AAA family ATPase n=1 Tax=Actinomadura chokoriensis TaxID=454156 RepID=UPI0031F98D09
AGLAPLDSAAAPYGTGLYAPEWNHRTYRELADRATKLLRLGETVILDASWTSKQQRDLLALVAEHEHAHLTSLRCEAPQSLTAERIRTRTQGASDADTTIATAMHAHAAPWPESTPINTSGTLTNAVEQALNTLQPHGPEHK